MPAQSNAHLGVHGPDVARVAISTLRDLRCALDGDASPAKLAEMRRDLDHLIATAEERAWPL